MENHNSQQNISIQSDEEITISKKRRYRSHNMPNYARIGITEGNEDLIDILGTISKKALTIFILMKKSRQEETNLVTLPQPTNQSETNAQNLALRELNKVNLVKRVNIGLLKDQNGKPLTIPKRTFLINPFYLFPRTNENFETAFNYWTQLENSL